MTGSTPDWVFEGFYGADDPRLESMSAHDRLEHFIKHDVGRGVDPHPLFDIDFYVGQVPGLDREEALAHYVDQGAAFGLSPHPLFDPAFYQERAGPVADPLGGYLADGWRSGFDPHPLFSVDYYQMHAPDVAESGVDPLTHYVTTGGRELRRHHPLFDPRHYLTSVLQAGGGAIGELPLRHYLRTGGVVDPTPHFSSRWYLANCEDARESPLTPLVHWLTVGARLGVSPSARGLPELATDLLLSGDPLGALLALTYVHSDHRGFPWAPRAVAYGFPVDRRDQAVEEGLVVGGLPGVVVGEKTVFGAVPPEMPTNIARGELSAVVRPDRVLASGMVNRSQRPLDGTLVPELPFEAGEADWLLEAIPSIWEYRARRSDATLVLPLMPPEFILEVLRDVIGWVRIASVHDGEFQLLRRTTIARAAPGALAEFRNALWRHHVPRDRRIVLVSHRRDPFDAESRSLLRRAVIRAGGVAVDIEWGAQVVRSALEDAATVLVAEGLPHTVLLAPPGCRLVSMAHNHDDVLGRAEGTGLVVDRLALAPIESDSHAESHLLDVTMASDFIEAASTT